jgi:hypothetical protein
MRIRVVSLALVAGLGLAGPWAARLEACSLCQGGDPTYSLVGARVFEAGAVRLSLDGDRYSKEQVAITHHEEETEAHAGEREEEVENRVTLSASHSFGDRVSLLARLPFSHRTITTGDVSESRSGISDPELLGHVRLLSSGAGDWVSATAGVKTPWGQNELTLDGERAEEHLQPGTGAWGGSAGLAFGRGFQGRSSLYGSVFGRFNGRNDFGYKYGDVLLANLAYERRLASRLNGVVEMNFRSAQRDEEVQGEPDPNTGGNVLYVSPRLLLRVTGDLWLRAGVQIPVWKDLYGDQDEHVNVLVGLTVKL